MTLKRPISASAQAASGREAEVGEVGRQVRRDERDVEAADEEAGGQQQVARVRQRAADRVARGDSGSSSACSPRPVSATASSGTSATKHDSITSAGDGAVARDERLASGAKRNWPSEPAAVASPTPTTSAPPARDARSGQHDRERRAREPEPDQHAAGQGQPVGARPPPSATGRSTYISDAARDHAAGAVAVGDHPRETAGRAPTRGSARRTRARTSRGRSRAPPTAAR